MRGLHTDIKENEGRRKRGNEQTSGVGARVRFMEAKRVRPPDGGVHARGTAHEACFPDPQGPARAHWSPQFLVQGETQTVWIQAGQRHSGKVSGVTNGAAASSPSEGSPCRKKGLRFHSDTSSFICAAIYHFMWAR